MIGASWLCLAIRFATSHVARGHAPPAASRSLLFLVELVVAVAAAVRCRGLQSHFQLQWQFNFGDVAACTCQLTSARYRPDTDPDTDPDIQPRWDCDTAPMGLRYRSPDTDPMKTPIQTPMGLQGGLPISAVPPLSDRILVPLGIPYPTRGQPALKE